jgi:hypothetical protein
MAAQMAQMNQMALAATLATMPAPVPPPDTTCADVGAVVPENSEDQNTPPDPWSDWTGE